MTVAQSFPGEELNALYQEDYFRGREYVDYPGDKSAHQQTLAGHLRRVRRYVPAGGRILEIGCAHGYFLELAQSCYPGSIGVDISAYAVAHARARGLDARHGDLASLALPERFDAVCLWDTLEHLPRPDETLRRACGLLRPEGYLFLATGDLGALLPRLRGRHWRQIHPPTHLFYFTRASLRALCQRLGLRVLRFGTVCVHRRVGSALKAMAREPEGSLLGWLAAKAARATPDCVLRQDIPLNLGDTLHLVARRCPQPAS